MAKLCGAMEVALIFAKNQGYITEAEYDFHGDRAYEAFQMVFEQNINSLVEEKPSQKFLSAIAEICQQTPDRICETGSSVIPQDALGCYDEEYLYLFADSFV